ncbi:MAG: serine/threonine-protein phosphatase [Deferribacteraceae bacterium]|jgi:sigma-B regulation protein RsbU (phosphoserine phosphatase)|nr:serine/threonine-protein phosphatase [Deferribacteraceae bacterium]
MNLSKLLGKFCVVFAVDENYCITYASPRLTEIIGRETAGEICYSAVAGRSAPCPFCVKDKREEEKDGVHDIISTDGSRRVFAVEQSAEGKEIVESLHNITEIYKQNNSYRHAMKELKAKQIEASLKSRAIRSDYDFLMGIVNNVPYGLLVIDRNQKIVMSNYIIKEWSPLRTATPPPSKCYHFYGYNGVCKDCPFVNKKTSRSSRTMGDRNVTVSFEHFNEFLVESVRDTTRELHLINEIRLSQEENDEKQRQMALLNKDLLRMNDQLKIAQNLINDELKQVGELQQSLLPESLPAIKKYAFGSFYTPAEHAGGDYYDCIEMSNGYWGFTIADVSGHGTPAAVIMAMARAIMRSYTYDIISSAEALMMVNEILCDNVHTRDFVTMFYTVFNSNTGEINYASAGHNPVLHFDRSDMMVRKLSAEGMFLAAFPGMEYEEKKLTLYDGDILFMYTDGLVEAMNAEREQYGLDRVISRLIMYSDTDCSRIIEEIMDDVRGFTGGKPFEDDVTIFVVKKL